MDRRKTWIYWSQARLEDDAELVDIAISEGKITAVAPNIEESAATTIEAKVVIPGLIESHIHLDKALIADREPNNSGTLQEAIKLRQSWNRPLPKKIFMIERNVH